ncbi:hypothetical protein K469DRAFT_685212 [Zopfia rhizophila CBS 207.26]|uniref:Extracellular membrane protein CFEM domain-containing protein n=1 Tax=Zopfia rhizophila CBS 207.26 TaxID=1314779 RepID=A0A6A6D5Y9_9PEZI|nr:hypothetical protein K469DRAFT_685212 [Zopfia rhizophila CBS 207.26]
MLVRHHDEGIMGRGLRYRTANGANAAQSQCLISNQTCIYKDHDLYVNISKCVKISCTLKEALTVKNVSTICGDPVRDNLTSIQAIHLTLVIIAIISVILQIYARLNFNSVLYIDDWVIILTG